MAKYLDETGLGALWAKVKAYVDSKTGSNVSFGTIYPVGCIYMSVTAASPATLFGGTWVVWGTGRVPVGIDTGQVEFNTIEKPGGAKAQVLAVASLPPHSHGLNNHTHSVPAHSHGLNNHNHSIPALSGSAASAGAHTHPVKFTRTAESGSKIIRPDASGKDVAQATDSAGAHTHSITTKASTTGGNSGATANSAALTSGGSAVATANAGSGTALNNLQPYITCYMWKRTA